MTDKSKTVESESTPVTATIPADANTVTVLLANKLAQTERENAILQAQLQAALKHIPPDVLDTIK